VAGSPEGTYHLVSFLTSPLVPETQLYYVLFATGGAKGHAYRWRVRTDTGSTITTGVTDVGVFHWTATRTGSIEVVVEIVIWGSIVATVSLEQTVGPPDPVFEALPDVVPADRETARELVNDLKSYIVAAAAGTGAKGVPALDLPTSRARRVLAPRRRGDGSSSAGGSRPPRGARPLRGAGRRRGDVRSRG
jgi:hypothetical protein